MRDWARGQFSVDNLQVQIDRLLQVRVGMLGAWGQFGTGRRDQDVLEMCSRGSMT